MENNTLTELVEKYNRHKTSTIRQTIIYPDVSNEDLSRIIDLFPEEYDHEAEVPLLFYLDGPNWDDTIRWFMLSNKKLYCKLFYYTHAFNVVDCWALSGIEKIEIKKNYILDNRFIVNGHKIGSLILFSKREASYLNNVIELMLNNNDKEEITDVSSCTYEKNYLPKGWEDLSNAQLFIIARNYFSRKNLARRAWGFEDFHYGPFIPTTTLERARNTYADYNSEDEVCILLVDNTFIGTYGSIEPSGFVVTNKYLYYKLHHSLIGKYTINKILLSDIKRIRVKTGFKGSLFINNNKPYILNNLHLQRKMKQKYSKK